MSTGSPSARLPEAPPRCPVCDRGNDRGRGWVEYTGNPDYPVVGCGNCGHVVYVERGEPGWAEDASRDTAPVADPSVCACGHALARHRPADHQTLGPGCWLCRCDRAPDGGPL